MAIWILNFGEGSLALNYLIFTTIASLGVLQFVAGRGRLVGLMPFPAKVSKWLGVALVAGSYIWFFTVQPDLLIPGLAGGEFFTLFLTGLVLALLIAIVLGILANRIFARASLQSPRRRESVMFAGGEKGELWLPEHPMPPLVIALREDITDSLDHLGSDLVAGGAAVLFCDAAAAQEAMQFSDRHADRFHRSRRYAMGLGRGADRVLKWAGEEDRFRAVLALAPYGHEGNPRPGLHWLRETDYLGALAVTAKPIEIRDGNFLASACIIYGDEDSLISPAAARQSHPSALMVAGARHFTLARMAATRRLAGDWFELPSAAAEAPGRVKSPASPLGGGLGE